MLACLAITGSIYLYKAEIERALYRDWIELPSGMQMLPVREMIEAVQQQTAGRVTQITRPAAENESWRFAVEKPNGEELAFVRPDTGLVLGTSRPGGPLELIKNLHSLTVAGPIANVLVEIVAGWTIVLVLTGFYLWWPRGGNKALSVAGRVGERRFWRNLHASTGALAGAVILFLAVTGMPWTAFWGARFHAFVAANQIGRPKPPAVGNTEHEEHLPWSQRGQAMPHVASGVDVGPDRVLAAAQAAGLGAPWTLDLPPDANKPYRLAPAISRAQQARVLYVEPSSGRIVQDNRWAEFGPGAKAFEWGIYTHQGQQFGEANRLLMLSGCVGVLLLAATAPILWWKRRFAPPPEPAGGRRGRGLAGIMLAVGALFPLTGATMMAALVVTSLRRRMADREVGQAQV